MLAGLLATLRTLVPEVSFSGCVPFDVAPLRARFPEVDWRPYDDDARERAITECDVWLGAGGSPFQHALSRWFLDHLLGDAARCGRLGKPMYYLGVGVQSAAEIASPDVQRLGAQAAGIWTRDPTSAERLAGLPCSPMPEAAADLAHLFFRASPPPTAKRGRLTLVANFDYGAWPGRDAVLQAVDALAPQQRAWLAQETRELPGAERTLHSALPVEEKRRWPLVIPDAPGTTLREALQQWPSGEWLVTARYHAALAGAWAGSKVVVIATNEKLRAAARELQCPAIEPDAAATAVSRALELAAPTSGSARQAELAFGACAAFVRAALPARR